MLLELIRSIGFLILWFIPLWTEFENDYIFLILLDFFSIFVFFVVIKTSLEYKFFWLMFCIIIILIILKSKKKKKKKKKKKIKFYFD